jgi:preprotein translocase subunit SecA|uniref:Protein translocase subunit SecA n=1 Tax=Cyclotella sp. WC03_2 TaxID=1549164 RepID=A0A089VHE1_9STRA|nr:preprotein-translocase subunit a [Cyclotella sp. WC03_2]AIR75666.1 preprotein-translocase subunit a [Cyclotella sp. WC03_2]
MLKNPFIKQSVINQYQTLINQINSLETNLKTLTDTELRNKTFQLKKQYREKGDLNALIAESFAITREASFRTLGLRHFDVQLIGGLVLNSGKISEMRTGEGKTLVATLPAVLNALTNKGVHIVTVNDYLASRDQISMGQIYRFLGLNTGLIQEDMTFRERQKNYAADITYVTNNELAFDYLRDNMASNLNQVVLPPFNYCIVDEVDSIFIDEAQVPLIISQAVETCIDKYIVAAEVAEYLEVNVHFKVDEKNRNIILTEQGTTQIEKILQIEDLYNPNDPWIPYILSAIKATALFFRNVHYIVQNNQIVIVDEFTGRIMPDRRWNEGLHQAIEAKESVPIRQNTETAASITYQNFFLLYPKLSGMTGTAKTSELEFEKIYGLSVEEIPTARPNLRKDLPDFVYKDSLTKWTAIAKECKSIAKTKQPILIGTTTVENSEMLADLLKEYQLSYRLLNAKPENVKRESEIVAQAGEIGSITIATNMAGRGTDIILGGNITFKVRKQLYKIIVYYKSQKVLTTDIDFTSQKVLSVLKSLFTESKFLSLSSTGILKFLNEIDQIRIPKTAYECSIKFLLTQLSQFEKKTQTLNNKIVKNLGGLYIIGTERNNSRRIDNQLRGRCGRQGDPGTSRFFLSLEDSLFRNFGSSNLQNFMQSQLLDDLPLESNLLTKSLDAAQKRVEERDYDGRKYLFDYDDILNKQRNIVYYERRKLLESQSLRQTILAYGEQVIKDIINLLKDDKFYKDGSGIEELFKTRLVSLKYDLNTLDSFELKTYLFQEFWLSYETKVLEFEICEIGLIRSFERTIILYYTDIAWKEHLQKIALLRDAVGWRSYGQRNPLFEFKEEAYNLFQNRNVTVRHLLIRDFLHSFIL